MAYCRWSSDNWKSDVYCYENVSGAWTTHVAGRKHRGEIPPLGNIGSMSAEEFQEAYRRQNEALDKAELVPIGLPFDGQSFDDEGPEGMLARLRELKSVGYHIPEYVFGVLEEEIAEQSQSNGDGNRG